ncbi:MAG TPA: ATP-dependent sacrificial sulfur transferase LarE [Thermomicrobiales bacterium]|nr:ATP-dependent sacrificial sulfur transferase LarE [Thermomicrobiales bacterium]
MLETTERKYARLEAILREMGTVLVAFSAGVDSTLVLKVAHDVLGDRALGVTGDSASLAPEEFQEARDLVARIGARHLVLRTEELNDPNYAANPTNRCYFCKSELYTKLRRVADDGGIAWIVDGSNADDVGDWRPGMQAARERGVRSPLQEAGLTKAEVREISAHLGLPTADKPAAACLSSRIPYGMEVTVAKLRQIGAAESALRRLGYRGFRVRHHGDVARLEFREDDLDGVLARRAEVLAAVKDAGFKYVALDLQGYRMGSLNEVLREAVKS